MGHAPDETVVKIMCIWVTRVTEHSGTWRVDSSVRTHPLTNGT